MSTESTGWVLLTNDDGIEALGFELLVKALHKEGLPLVIFAPSENHSATGMRINLMKPMTFRGRDDLKDTWGIDGGAPIHFFEIDGTPCDSVIVALDGGLEHVLPGCEPRLVVSGVNLGPNMSQDSLHSGTMGAAREAGLYGMPAIASSFTSFEPEGMEKAIQAPVELTKLALNILPMKAETRGRPHIDFSKPHISPWPQTPEVPAWQEDPIQALRTAFSHGELMLNLNVPPTWDGNWATTRLGARWYRNAVVFNGSDEEETATFTIGGATIDHGVIAQGDTDAVLDNKASVSCMPCWPQTHPLALDDRLLTWTLEACDGGYPLWLR